MVAEIRVATNPSTQCLSSCGVGKPHKWYACQTQHWCRSETACPCSPRRLERRRGSETILPNSTKPSRENPAELFWQTCWSLLRHWYNIIHHFPSSFLHMGTTGWEYVSGMFPLSQDSCHIPKPANCLPFIKEDTGEVKLLWLGHRIC